VQAVILGGSFGRLYIPPAAMTYLDVIFQQLWEALSRERKLLEQFQTIEIQKDRIDLISKPMAQ